MIALGEAAPTTGIAVRSPERTGPPSAGTRPLPPNPPSRFGSRLLYRGQAMVGDLSLAGRVCTRAELLEVRRGR